jgi:hypothetical protein
MLQTDAKSISLIANRFSISKVIQNSTDRVWELLTLRCPRTPNTEKDITFSQLAVEGLKQSNSDDKNMTILAFGSHHF